jgi:sterol desaturase/sphingolipid hydroxylase (fatty acid hydroxylase superfamily)
MVDTLVMHGYYALAPFILPIPPLALIAHRLYDQVNGMLGHAGFEYFASSSTRWPSPMVCVTFHDQHHSAFRFNYGNFTSIWDRLMGTLHPDYDVIVSKLTQNQSPASSG